MLASTPGIRAAAVRARIRHRLEQRIARLAGPASTTIGASPARAQVNRAFVLPAAWVSTGFIVNWLIFY